MTTERRKTLERYVDKAGGGLYAIGADGSKVVVSVVDYEGDELGRQDLLVRALESIWFALAPETESTVKVIGADQVETTDHGHAPKPGDWHCLSGHSACTESNPCAGCRANRQLYGASPGLERPRDDAGEPT